MHQTSSATARTTRVFAILLLAIGLGGCVTSDVRSHYDHGSYTLWHGYHYYPTLAVYVDLRDGYYWHHDHDRWHRVKQLPPHYRLHQQPRVLLHLDTDRPYLEHARHRARYAGQSEPRDGDRGHHNGQRGERPPVPAHSRQRDDPGADRLRDSERRKLRQTHQTREGRPDSRASSSGRTASSAADGGRTRSVKDDARLRPGVRPERHATPAAQREAGPSRAERPAAKSPARQRATPAAREPDTRRQRRDTTDRDMALTQRRQPETGRKTVRNQTRGDSLRQNEALSDRRRHAGAGHGQRLGVGDRDKARQLTVP